MTLMEKMALKEEEKTKNQQHKENDDNTAATPTKMASEEKEKDGTTIQDSDADGAKKASDNGQTDSTIPGLAEIESRFKEMMEQFNSVRGFSVDAPQNAFDSQVELLGEKGVILSIAMLLTYIRHCINNHIKKDIVVKIGQNKPAGCPFNFTLNDSLLEDIYPGDVVEIN